MSMTAEVIAEKKCRLLSELKAIRASHLAEHLPSIAKLESEIFELVPHILKNYPTKTLRHSEFVMNTKFCGYLYNTGNNKFTTVDEDGIYLYASADSQEDAVLWEAWRNTANRFFLTTALGPAKKYFSWRAITGACKLYPSYDELMLDWNYTVEKDQTKFTFQSYYHGQLIGTYSLTNDELYVRGDTTNTTFEFRYINLNELSDDDKLLFDIYKRYCANS